MKKWDAKSFFGGLLVGSLFFSGLSLAAGKTLIEVETNNPPLTYYFNGIPKSPANGQQGFLYKNTTYVPLRFITDNLGSNVIYDPNTASLYIGKFPTVKMYSKLEAVRLVKSQLGPEFLPHYEIEYDHDDERGNYVIQVYERVVSNFQTGDNFIKTHGWFTVNPSTGAVTQLF